MLTAQVRIRRATRDDAETIVALGRRTFRDAFGADNDPADMEAYLAKAFAPARIAAELADAASTFLLAHAGGQVAGYAKLKASPKPPCVNGSKPLELQRLYIAQEVIGLGIGSALLEACLAEARANGCDTLWLGVWERNERAQRFYRQWGFSAVGAKDFTIARDVQRDLILQRPVVRAI